MSAKNYPRLINALTRQGILSRSEAQACIEAFKAGRNYSSEAVNHYGGVKRMMRDAIHYRNVGRIHRGEVIAAFQNRQPCPHCRRRGRLFAHPDWCMVWGISLDELNGQS